MIIIKLPLLAVILENQLAPSLEPTMLAGEVHKGTCIVFFLCTSTTKQNAWPKIIIHLLNNERTGVYISAFPIFFVIFAKMEYLEC